MSGVMPAGTFQAANFQALSPVAFLRRSASVFPEKTAIIYGRRRHTYAEFATLAEHLATAIRARIAPGDRVAFLAPNVPEMLIAHFAVPLAGGVLVAVNSRLSASEVQYILRHSGARLLFIDAELAGDVGNLRVEAPGLEMVVEIPDPEFGQVQGDADLGQVPLEEFLSQSANKSDLAWDASDELSALSINYTSGTTGEPKGVVYSHRGAYLNSMGELIHNRYDHDTVYLWTLPMFHCNGWSAPWAVTAAAGTHVCLRAVRGPDVWHAIDTVGVTHLSGSPAVCNIVLNAQEAHPVGGKLSITTAGAAPSPTSLAALESLKIRVVHVYGLTEVYGPFTVNEYQPSWADLPASERAQRLARQGVAMLQAEAPRVVDEHMRDVPADGQTIGEILLRGNNVMGGYHRDPEATAEAFRGGYFHTGDLGVVHSDGYIQVKDRSKDIIISGGENISSIDVENALVSHPAVNDAAVIGVADEKWGERPIAFVLLMPGLTVEADELREHVRGKLARFKVPDSITFVDELPRTATGKVTKGKLRAAMRSNART